MCVSIQRWLLLLCIAEGIAQHMRNTMRPGSVELKTFAEFVEFLNADDNCLLGKLSVWLILALRLHLHYLLLYKMLRQHCLDSHWTNKEHTIERLLHVILTSTPVQDVSRLTRDSETCETVKCWSVSTSITFTQRTCKWISVEFLLHIGIKEHSDPDPRFFYTVQCESKKSPLRFSEFFSQTVRNF